MHCLACGTQDTKVLDSRVVGDGTAIRRRRECESCGHRFSTLEQVELLRVMVVKKDGRREPYSREKLENGIRTALEKRPVPEAKVREIIGTIERKLQTMDGEEIATKKIGSFVMHNLKEVDEVAYIRFASVYKSFRDAEKFGAELERLKHKKRRELKKK